MRCYTAYTGLGLSGFVHMALTNPPSKKNLAGRITAAETYLCHRHELTHPYSFQMHQSPPR